MNKKSRKAQMEILGLAVVVILLIIGMLFAMKYMIKKPEIRTEASDKQLAIAFLNTLTADKLEVTDCKQGVELKELLQDCTSPAERKSMCSDGTTAYCIKAGDVTKSILKDTLGTMKKEYDFKLQKADKSALISAASGKCTSGSNKVQVTYPLPTDGGTIFAVLSICS